MKMQAPENTLKSPTQTDLMETKFQLSSKLTQYRFVYPWGWLVVGFH
jgi:hypothetical protein